VKLSVIVPALDEAQAIEATLAAIAPARALGAEVIVVDGGSRDATRSLAAHLRPRDRVAARPRRADERRRARAHRRRAPLPACRHVPAATAHGDIGAPSRGGREWGRFDVVDRGRGPDARGGGAIHERALAADGSRTGDQAIFATRAAFDAAGGFPAIPLMEDVALSKALARRRAGRMPRERVVTSGRAGSGAAPCAPCSSCGGCGLPTRSARIAPARAPL
jgi:hypothetical protein